MTSTPRRTFLKRATQALAALPVISMLPASVGAQDLPKASGKNKPHPTASSNASVHLNVREMGAVGDGKTKDTLALQQALDRCNVLGGGEVLVPKGEYMTGALVMRSNTVLRLEEGATLLGSPDLADYPLTQVRWEGRWVKGRIGFISAEDAENIAIVGRGRIVANTEIKGRLDRATGMRNPALLEFTSCRNVRVEDCFTVQNDMWSIHPTYCENVTFKNVSVHGGADGIDVDSCQHVVIDGCEFDTADDCISLKSGRGWEGYKLLRTTEDVRISNCTFLDHRWACIGIGSETSGGIRNVRVEHCKCLAARTFAIYIKSRPGRGAFIEDITIDDLDVSDAQAGFLRINILDSGKQDEFPVAGDEGIPSIRNFRFNNIRVKDEPVLVEAVNIHPNKPLDGFTLTNVTGTCGKGMFLANMKNVVLRGINVTGYSGALVNTYNVTGTGLQGSVALEKPKTPEAVVGPERSYVLK